VATALDETAGNTDGGALAGDHHDGRGSGMTLGEDGAALHTSADLDGAEVVRAGAAVVVDPLDALEAVGVDDQRAPADAAGLEVVAGVADDQTDVVFARKVDAGLDVLAGGRLDDVDTVVAKRAGLGWVRRGPARLVGSVGPESGRQLLNAAHAHRVSKQPLQKFAISGTYCHCSLPQLAVDSWQAASSYVLTVPRGPWKVLWQTAPGGMCTVRAPPTVRFSVFHEGAAGQHFCPG